MSMPLPRRPLVVLSFLLAALLAPCAALAQSDGYDASWYDPDAPYVKIGVATDGVYRVDAASLAPYVAGGLSAIDPATLRLIEHGREVPLRVDAAGSQLGTGDALYFVGRRNTGESESWAWETPAYQGSTHYSLYTDTTHYWLTWGGAPGLRYATPAAPPSPSDVAAARDTSHAEIDDSGLYYFGDTFSAGKPRYTRGEGYYWHRFSHSTGSATPLSFLLDVPLPSPVADASESALIRAHFYGETNAVHKLVLEARLDGGTYAALDTVQWSGFGFATVEASVAQDRLPTDGTLALRLTSLNEDNIALERLNRVLLDWAEVVYTRTLSLGAGQVHWTADAGATRYTLSGLDGSADVYAPAAAARFALTDGGGTATFSHDALGTTTYWAVDAGAYRTPASLAADRASDLAGAATRADYVVLAGGGLETSAQAMADYRASTGHEVAVVRIQDVFDQFDAGRASPLAIRRFVRQAQSWAVPMQYLMIWADGLYPDRQRPRRAWEVPSFGNRASDAWFAVQNDGPSDWSEIVAVGRNPVRTDAQGQTFIDKMRTYETAPAAAWQKRAMFVVGGDSEAQQADLQRHTLTWSEEVARPPSGLDTLHFFKSSEAALDPTFKDSLRAALRNGALWLSYFGHSAAQSWEVVTDPPREFDNAGRLPIVLSLGCFTGDFAGGDGDPDDLLSFSEQLVFETANGAIAHWGASASGSIGPSADLSDSLHVAVFADTMRLLGPALQAAKAAYIARRSSDPLAIKHVLQYGLIGDPATRIRLPAAPDLAVAPGHIQITPLAPLPSDSTLTVDVVVQNFGLVPADSVDVRLVHTPPGGAARVFDMRVPPIMRSHAHRFALRIGDDDVGENRIETIADPDARIAESDETNNSATVSRTVFSSGVTMLVPAHSAVATRTAPVLTAVVSTTDAEPVVAFEIDSTPSFDSPDLQRGEVAVAGLTAQWTPTSLRDGAVYYWRARLADATEDNAWKQAALVVRTDAAPGWAQQEALFDGNTQEAFLERVGDRWAFSSYTIDASASSERGSGVYKGQFVVNGNVYERVGGGFGLLVLDGGTGQVRASLSAPTYQHSISGWLSAEAARDSLRAVAERIAPGDYVLVRTRHLGRSGGEIEIPDDIKDVFRSLGSTAIDTLSYRDLWIMAGRLGEPMAEWTEPYGTEVNEILQEVTLTFTFGEGATLSPLVGPAAEWNGVSWNGTTEEAASIQVDVVDAAGETVLAADVSPDGALLPIDARAHPYVRLRGAFRDSTQRSTPQLERWHVAFTPTAELALDPRTVVLSPDTAATGQPIRLDAALVAVNGETADTVHVELLATDAQGALQRIWADTLHGVGATPHALSAMVETSTLGGAGRVELVARQPGAVERLDADNVAVRGFHVAADASAPSLSVLIDGEPMRHDPEPVRNLQDPAYPFVSLTPTVRIRLEDDNDFLPLEGDSTLVQVELDGARIPFSRLQEPGKRSRSVTYEVTLDLAPTDTVHTLTVRASDASENSIPEKVYQVHFRTQTTLEVPSVYPYPNPMGSHTRFAFQLRGADALSVEAFRLRIFTLNGRLVREFDLIEQPELVDGGLRIGWNQVHWDGRDADGDPVASGVYLYRVEARADGRALPLGAGGGVEKVVVLR